MDSIFFESWTKVGHVALLTIIAFVTFPVHKNFRKTNTCEV